MHQTIVKTTMGDLTAKSYFRHHLIVFYVFRPRQAKMNQGPVTFNSPEIASNDCLEEMAFNVTNQALGSPVKWTKAVR